jgi:hypothetical protein
MIMNMRKGRQKKAWHKGSAARKIGIRDPRPRILIVCEGEKTEPNYFRGFRLPSVVLKVVPAGAQHKTVVKKAVDLKSKDNDYDEIWCVFDRDKNTGGGDKQAFNEAISIADKNEIKVAYSNDAFELWYLLHFGYYHTAISRSDYIVKLNKLIPDGYKKNDPNMFLKLENKMDDAIRNAKKLHQQWAVEKPEKADPSTTVYLLVEHLRELN